MGGNGPWLSTHGRGNRTVALYPWAGEPDRGSLPTGGGTDRGSLPTGGGNGPRLSTHGRGNGPRLFTHGRGGRGEPDRGSPPTGGETDRGSPPTGGPWLSTHRRTAGLHLQVAGGVEPDRGSPPTGGRGVEPDCGSPPTGRGTGPRLSTHGQGNRTAALHPRAGEPDRGSPPTGRGTGPRLSTHGQGNRTAALHPRAGEPDRGSPPTGRGTGPRLSTHGDKPERSSPPTGINRNAALHPRVRGEPDRGSPPTGEIIAFKQSGLSLVVWGTQDRGGALAHERGCSGTQVWVLCFGLPVGVLRLSRLQPGMLRHLELRAGVLVVCLSVSEEKKETMGQWSFRGLLRGGEKWPPIGFVIAVIVRSVQCCVVTQEAVDHLPAAQCRCLLLQYCQAVSGK
ncbi:hypothetical protein NDU88_002579 [Pleurodeles waltl]|uniref:Uncharacterized protein n=1 Tax=Pleurodeles waltl TaxID=8319 RepID=A0AAV7RAD8_PLEWA|nr:hypothetical protein NDU88_002579 [Pleurodeles waltl]